MCISNDLDDSSKITDSVDLDSELDITSGFTSDFNESFIWDSSSEPKKES